jgi:hypothetical protein
LAESIVSEYKITKRTNIKSKTEKQSKPLIIFADIIDKNVEEHLDLVERAKKLGAILFRKDMTSIRFKYFKKRKVSFYLISDDESEKIRHAKYIISNYDDKNSMLYLFSDEIESELFMKSYSDLSKNFGKEEYNAEKYLRITPFARYMKQEEEKKAEDSETGTEK